MQALYALYCIQEGREWNQEEYEAFKTGDVRVVRQDPYYYHIRLRKNLVGTRVIWQRN